jgi:hypothetical protein
MLRTAQHFWQDCGRQPLYQRTSRRFRDICVLISRRQDRRVTGSACPQANRFNALQAAATNLRIAQVQQFLNRALFLLRHEHADCSGDEDRFCLQAPHALRRPKGDFWIGMVLHPLKFRQGSRPLSEEFPVRPFSRHEGIAAELADELAQLRLFHRPCSVAFHELEQGGARQTATSIA